MSESENIKQYGSTHNDMELTLLDIYKFYLTHRKFIYISVFFFALFAAGFYLTKEPFYTSETTTNVVLGKNSNVSNMFENNKVFNMLKKSDPYTEIIISTITSKKFIKEFIEDNKLLPVLFYKLWDNEKNDWKSKDDVPTILEGVQYFKNKIFTAKPQDADSFLINFSILWRDPAQAADWLKILIQRLNEKIKIKAIETSQKNIEYLTEQLKNATLLEVRQTIANIIKEELMKSMVAKIAEQYAIETIDPPFIPEEKSTPKLSVYLAIGILLGFMFGFLYPAFRRFKKAAHTKNFLEIKPRSKAA